ncbi:MAG TPA: hypothetical protein VI749_07400 [Candidatus Omnitrophota bacterium]|nr:hypothetical protein [Candidatus Omnitrophota bacterium]
MQDFQQINRRDFLKGFPKYLASSLSLFTQEGSKPTDVTTEIKTIVINDNQRAKTAKVDTNCCLAWSGGSCQLCYLVCPLRDRAILMEDQKPVINASFCDGCAKCIVACQTVNDTVAIRLVLA